MLKKLKEWYQKRKLDKAKSNKALAMEAALEFEEEAIKRVKRIAETVGELSKIVDRRTRQRLPPPSDGTEESTEKNKYPPNFYGVKGR